MSRRRSATAVLALAAALALTGCSEEETPGLEEVGDTVSAAAGDLGDAARQAADEAGAALDDAQAALEDLAPDARAEVEEAVTSAGSAIEDAQAALENADDAEAVQAAEDSLAEAGDQVSAAAEDAEPEVRAVLESLGDRIADLTGELEAAAQ